MTERKEWKPCGAKTRSGRPCKTAAMANGRCRMHGGKSLGGLASPVLKHGRYSKVLPRQLVSNYKEMLEDARLPSLESEIALTMTRVEQLIGRIDTGEASAAWRVMTNAYDLMNESTRDEDRQRHLATILRVLAARRNDYMVWDDITRATEMLRRLIETHNKILLSRETTYTAEQIMVFMMTVSDLIRRRISDKKTAREIQGDLQRLAVLDAGASIRP